MNFRGGLHSPPRLIGRSCARWRGIDRQQKRLSPNQRPFGGYWRPHDPYHARRRPDLTTHLFEVYGLQPTPWNGAPKSKSADRPGHGRAACRPGLRPAADPRRRARATPSAHARRIFSGRGGVLLAVGCLLERARSLAAELPRLATGASCTVASTRALAAAPCLRVSEAGQTMSLSVYQCEGPCLLRPAPRRPAPTRGIGPAAHRKRPPRLGRCAGARRHLPNRLSDPASVQAQTGAGLRSRRGRRVQTPPDGPTAPLARLRRAAAAIREGRPNVEGSGVRGYEVWRAARAVRTTERDVSDALDLARRGSDGRSSRRGRARRAH